MTVDPCQEFIDNIASLVSTIETAISGIDYQTGQLMACRMGLMLKAVQENTELFVPENVARTQQCVESLKYEVGEIRKCLNLKGKAK